MRILCFGKNGLLSTELQKWLPQLAADKVVFLGKSECDITNPNQVNEVIESIKPTIIINAVAFTDVDLSEEKEALANDVNGNALEYIITQANRCGAILLHFSTDYVFDGKKLEPYEEEDDRNPLNAYGRSKLIGEKIIQETALKFYIMRVQWVFGHAKRNFIESMLELSSNNSEIDVVNDQIGSPTSTASISKAVVNLLHNLPAFGIYHFRTLNHCSWFEYATYIFESQGLDIKVNPVSSKQFKRKASRPKNSVLNISKWIYSDLYTPPTWKSDVLNYLQQKTKEKI